MQFHGIFSYNKPTRCTNFSNLFLNKAVHVSESSSVHHQELFTVHTANLYIIYHCCVYSEKTPDDVLRNCPKHVKFYSKNQFEKLVHLVGFIIRIPSYTCGLEMNKLYFFPGFCVLTAMMLKTQWYDDVTFCRLAGISRRFGGI